MPSSSAPPTFLNDVSDAARHNIFRHLSTSPALPHWSAFVDSEDALTSLLSSCSLRTIARACFTGRMFSNSFSVVDASCAGTVSLNCKRPTGLQLLDWIQAVGMSLSSLSVDRSLEVSLLTLGPAEVSFLAPFVYLPGGRSPQQKVRW